MANEVKNVNETVDAGDRNVEATQEMAAKTYTEAEVREIYARGQQEGYMAAIKQVRADINDYLNELLISVRNQK